jgi:hypothetical protein
MKHTIQILRLGLAAFLFATSSPALLAGPRDTGIEGQATLYISYGTPIEVEPGIWLGVGDVQLPVATSFSVLAAHSGHLVGRFTTDVNGVFAVSLTPGKYVVVPDTLTLPFGGSVSFGPFEVTVKAKKFTPANFWYYLDGPQALPLVHAAGF